MQLSTKTSQTTKPAYQKTSKWEWQTGDGTEVGIFFRLPGSLAKEFPSLGDEDRSPPHVTFLYVGRVEAGSEELFLDICRRILGGWGRPTPAQHMPLAYFDHPLKDRRVAILPVRFGGDVAGLRWRLREALIDSGFDVEDSFPLIYQPHTTLAYLDGLDSEFDGDVSGGRWEVTEAEVWGLPKVYRILLGREEILDLSGNSVSVMQKRVGSSMPDQVALLDGELDFNRLLRIGPIKNSRTNKPNGGLWTSSLVGKSSDWLDWCSGEMPEWVGTKAAIFKVKSSNKVLDIHSEEVLRDVQEIYPWGDTEDGMIDWEQVSKDYDAVHVSKKMARKSFPLRNWDVESTVWFRLDPLEIKTVVDVENKCRLRLGSSRLERQWGSLLKVSSTVILNLDSWEEEIRDQTRELAYQALWRYEEDAKKSHDLDDLAKRSRELLGDSSRVVTDMVTLAGPKIVSPVFRAVARLTWEDSFSGLSRSDFLDKQRTLLKDLRSYQNSLEKAPSLYDYDGTANELISKGRNQAKKVSGLIQAALKRVRNWGGWPVIIDPVFDKESWTFLERVPETFYVNLGKHRGAPGFTLFLDGASIESIDDILDAGDEMFFRGDAQLTANYFDLIKELKKPGSSQRAGRNITLYTARPTKDRHIYENARKIPSNIYLTTDYSRAVGISHDLGSNEVRDIWKVVVNEQYLIPTLYMRNKPLDYQTVGQGGVPVKSITLVEEGSTRRAGQVGLLSDKEWVRWASGKQARKLLITDKQIAEWRKEFLLLMSNLKKVKDFGDVETWSKGALKWGKQFERLMGQIREDLKDRIRENKTKKVWEKNVDESAAEWFLENQKPIWEFVWEVTSGKPDIPDVDDGVSRLMRWPSNLPEEEARRELLRGWLEKARLWTQRAKSKARDAWKFLHELGEWALRGGLYGGGERPVVLTQPERVNRSIAGFQVQMMGFEGEDFQVEGLEKLKTGLRFYAGRAQAVLPWLLKYQLPVVAYFVSGAAAGGPGSAAATYERDHIALYPWALHSDKRRFAHTMAHEMGHHLYKMVLSDEARKDWSTLIRGDYGRLDLRDVLAKVRPGENLYRFDDRIEKEDPILHIQLQTLLHSPSYKDLDLLGANQIREYLDRGGNPIVKVPSNPITGYGGKNTEEAFCEVIGRLVGYGPRTVLPQLKAWFRRFVPNVKVSARQQKADQIPPLGLGDGPCYVVRRIHDSVGDPRLKDDLTFKVEEGMALTNPEAAKIYQVEKEKGPGGPVKQFVIGPHAQYRMDLRGVTVTEIRMALRSFTKRLNDLKSRRDGMYDYYVEQLARRDTVEWTDPQINLVVVFSGYRRDTVKIVTVYWKGQKDPRPEGYGSCEIKLASNAAWLRMADADHRRSISLMKFLSDVARRLGVGKHVYVVGGAPRNFIIDKPIKDIDVVIDSLALGGKDSEWFATQVIRAIPVQANLTTNQYGVAIITVKGDWELEGDNLKGEVIEIANARKESYGGESGKGYKPSDVSPATIEEDVYRREYTFNTLLWRLHDLAKGPDKAEILDLTGCGLRDLQEGRMRCPSDPDKTFSDDPTRMLRAIKFYMKYGLKPTPDTVAAIRRNANKLTQAPPNAISELLIGTILKESGLAVKALQEMKRLGLLDVVADMVRSNKVFRRTMENWASNQKVQLLFDMADLGLPLNVRIDFLRPEQQKRLRELSIGLPEGQPEELVDVLRQPGRFVDMKRLIKDLSLKGPEIAKLTEAIRTALLEDPSRKSRQVEERAKQILTSGIGKKSKFCQVSRGEIVRDLRRRQSTKSRAEKEEEEDERLIRKEPKKNPPREDLRRERVREEDPDNIPLGADTDKDLSRNYKRIAFKVEKGNPSLYPIRKIAEEGSYKPGDVWETDSGNWAAKNPKGEYRSFPGGSRGKEEAFDWASGSSIQKDPDAPSEEGAAPGEGGGRDQNLGDMIDGLANTLGGNPEIKNLLDQLKDTGNPGRKPTREELELVQEVKDKSDGSGDVEDKLRDLVDLLEKKETLTSQRAINRILDRTKGLSFGEGSEIPETLKSMSTEDQSEFVSGFDSQMADLSSVPSSEFSAKALEQTAKALGSPLGSVGSSPEEKGRSLAKAVYAKTVISNPRWAGGSEILPGQAATQEQLEERAVSSYHQFHQSPPEILQEVANQLGVELETLPRDAPEREELERVADALALTAAVKGEKLEIDTDITQRDAAGNPILDENGDPLTERLSGELRPEPSQAFQTAARMAHEKGVGHHLLQGAGRPGSPEHRAGVREAMEEVFLDPDNGAENLAEFYKEREDTWGSGWGDIASWISETRDLASTGDPSDPETKKAIKQLGTAAWAQDVLTRWGVTALSTGEALMSGPLGASSEQRQDVKDTLKKSLSESEDMYRAMGILSKCREKAKTPEEWEKCAEQGELSVLRAMYTAADEAFDTLDPSRPVVAQVKTVIDTGDLSELDKPYVRQGGDPSGRESVQIPMPGRRLPGDVWETEDKWQAKNSKGVIRSWAKGPGSEEKAKVWAAG